MDTKMSLPLVSVMVNTRNEEKNIERCLKSIKNQSYKNIEIILVDDSSDRTKEIAKKYTDLIYDKGPERSVKRNYGVSVSNGEFILYIDADMILAPFVVESCVNEVKIDSSVLGLYIEEIILGKRLWSRVRRFERSFYNATPIDAIRFFKKETCLKVNGFDENMTGPDDWDFDRKISNLGKLKLVDSFKNPASANIKNILPKEIEKFLISNGIAYKDLYGRYNNVIFHNESNFKLSNYINKKSYYIKDFDKYINKWGKNDYIVKKQLGVFYRYLGVFTENGKWKGLVRHPILTLYMYFLKVIVGLVYFKYKFLNDK
jgi:glycosyltransferase involved in cell wall biosynthesis